MKRLIPVTAPLAAIALAFPLAAFAGHDMHSHEHMQSGQSTEHEMHGGQGERAEAPPAGQVETGKNGVKFVTGGVGAGEQAALKEHYSDFGLMLVNAAKKSGAYVADVDVKVRDAKGNEIIDTTTNGPWLLADLPAGRYTVEATYNGDTQTRHVSIGKEGQHRIVMHWAEGAS